MDTNKATCPFLHNSQPNIQTQAAENPRHQGKIVEALSEATKEVTRSLYQPSQTQSLYDKHKRDAGKKDKKCPLNDKEKKLLLKHINDRDDISPTNADHSLGGVITNRTLKFPTQLLDQTQTELKLLTEESCPAMVSHLAPDLIPSIQKEIIKDKASCPFKTQFQLHSPGNYNQPMDCPFKNYWMTGLQEIKQTCPFPSKEVAKPNTVSGQCFLKETPFSEVKMQAMVQSLPETDHSKNEEDLGLLIKYEDEPFKDVQPTVSDNRIQLGGCPFSGLSKGPRIIYPNVTQVQQLSTQQASQAENSELMLIECEIGDEHDDVEMVDLAREQKALNGLQPYLSDKSTGPSTDLNMIVDEILRNTAGQDYDESYFRRKRRWCLSKEQIWVLEKEFSSNPNVWAKAKYAELSKVLTITLPKLYKWNWDRRLKARKEIHKAEQSETVAQRGLALLNQMNLQKEQL